MKKSIIFFVITAAIFIGAPQSAVAQAGMSMTKSVVKARIPVKKIIKWIRYFDLAYSVYDQSTGNRMKCEEAYNYALYAYREYERLYILAYQYWGSSHGDYYYSGAIRAYQVAEYYHDLVCRGCR